MTTRKTPPVPDVHYPDSDGKPMADNTRQFRWIVTFQGGIDALFADDPNVFVAGDQLWYPIEGDRDTRVAPDVMVVFGRPKGDRGSYKQWCEEGVAPQVVIEVLSPSNTPAEMRKKHAFYERHGVEEYIIYDPDHEELVVSVRRNGILEPVEQADGWTSPRLGIRFDFAGGTLRVIRPDGEPFVTFGELHERSRRLAEKLRDLGVDPDAV